MVRMSLRLGLQGRRDQQGPVTPMLAGQVIYALLGLCSLPLFVLDIPECPRFTLRRVAEPDWSLPLYPKLMPWYTTWCALNLLSTTCRRWCMALTWMLAPCCMMARACGPRSAPCSPGMQVGAGTGSQMHSPLPSDHLHCSG